MPYIVKYNKHIYICALRLSYSACILFSAGPFWYKNVARAETFRHPYPTFIRIMSRTQCIYNWTVVNDMKGAWLLKKINICAQCQTQSFTAEYQLMVSIVSHGCCHNCINLYKHHMLPCYLLTPYTCRLRYRCAIVAISLRLISSFVSFSWHAHSSCR